MEVGSGTGQHLLYFARALPELIWQPTDPDAEFRESIMLAMGRENRPNVRSPLDLDVRRPWPVARADAVVCINMTHVAPWVATTAFLDGAARVLPEGGTLFLYGPFTSQSNEAFAHELRAHNPEWGLRDIEEVTRVAEQKGLRFRELVEMPANNFSLVFRKLGACPNAEGQRRDWEGH